MLVANSFDLWQKDTFFSAAEEVQKSSDIMESSYRTWLRGRREGWIQEHLDELARELQMALGTAKWQLEEFEKAVRMSYRSHGDDITINRHGQFVSALEEKIALVESDLKESYEVEGKKPFRWINLDEEECDDFALFLSGTLQGVTNQAVATSLHNKKNGTKEDSKVGPRVSFKNHKPKQGKSLQELITINEDSNCFVEQEESRFLETGDDDIRVQADKSARNHKTWSPLERSALEIVIDKDDRRDNALVQTTPREKGSKSFLLNSRVEDRVGAKGVSGDTQSKLISWINKRLRGGHKSQRLMSPAFPVNSIRFVLALMLTIFLMVPFLVYSN